MNQHNQSSIHNPLIDDQSIMLQNENLMSNQDSQNSNDNDDLICGEQKLMNFEPSAIMMAQNEMQVQRTIDFDFNNANDFSLLNESNSH